MGADGPPPAGDRSPSRHVIVLIVALLAMGGLNLAEFDAVERRSPHQYKALWEHREPELERLAWHTTQTNRRRFAVYLVLGRTAADHHVLVHEDMGFRRHKLIALTRAASVEITDYDAEVDEATMTRLREDARWRNRDRRLGSFAVVEPEDGGGADMVAVRHENLIALVPAELAAELGVGR